MILGIGADIVDSRRLERPLRNHSERFLSKIMTEQERIYVLHRLAPLKIFLDEEKHTQRLSLQIAKIFAAKEAFVKALGTGFRGGLGFLDIEIQRNALGKPTFQLHSKAQEVFQNLIPFGMEGQVHLSLSDEYPYAQAFVTLSAF